MCMDMPVGQPTHITGKISLKDPKLFELRDVVKNYGYTVDITEAYVFERGRPFNSYVEHFYEVKSNATNEVERFIAKLMLNSLYGRMGLRPQKSTTQIFHDSPTDKNKFDSFITSNDILNSITLSSGVNIVTGSPTN
ncbi:hypothetical protein HK096_008487 [Nowakowskiella sp. JEL0078]|nr:hypothetical protein HK096_008487 [Nowakowskiella sp. JEL0078]